jgi:replicative DNA helicase
MSDNVFSQDAELAVINLLLLNPELIFSTQSLKPFMFNSTSHTLIYSTMTELAERGAVPEVAMVVTDLADKGKIREAGGNEYIQYIKNLVYNKDNLNEFVTQVKTAYKGRTVLGLNSLVSSITAGSNVDAVVSELKHRLDNLDEISGGEMVVDFHDASADMWTELLERIEKPGIRGVTTGFKDLDLLTGGYNAGDVWVVAGRPGMGKTADLCNSALAVAKSGVPALIFPLEMNKTQLVERMISIESGVSLGDIRLGTLNQQQLDKISDSIKVVKQLPIYIDTNFNTDDTYFGATVRKYEKLKGVRVVFFDYIQLATERDNNQTAEIGKFSRTAKLMSNDLGITTILYSQLNRGVEAREDKRPVLSDLRQSGNLEEDADIVEFLYRDEYYNRDSKASGTVEKIIRKHRNGPIGTLFMTFDAGTIKIADSRRN